MATEQPKVPFFKKGKSRPTTANRRQRSPSPPASALHIPISSSSKSEVVLPSRKTAGNLLSAGTKRTLTQREREDLEAAGDDADRERNGPDVKYSASSSHQAAALEILAGDEAAAILAKRARKEALDAGIDPDDEEGPNDGMYRGQKAYKSHIQKSKDVPKSMRTGPQQNTGGGTIKMVTVVDYQPDVCKDYKETGYCGFGDTCKFLHDRGTYLAGWQLDKLSADPKRQAGDASASDSDDEDVPFACLICRKPYTDPVVTRCGHYFCSACAIKRFAKTPKCIACGAPTAGIFNKANKIIEKLNKKKEAKEAEEGEEDQDETGCVAIEGLAQDGGGPGERRESGSESDDSDDE